MTDENQTPKDDDFVLGVDPENPDTRPLVESKALHDAITEAHVKVQIAQMGAVMTGAFGDKHLAYMEGMIEGLAVAHELAHGGNLSDFLGELAREAAKQEGLTDEEFEAQEEAANLMVDQVIESTKRQIAMKKDVESAFDGLDFDSLTDDKPEEN